MLFIRHRERDPDSISSSLLLGSAERSKPARRYIEVEVSLLYVYVTIVRDYCQIPSQLAL